MTRACRIAAVAAVAVAGCAGSSAEPGPPPTPFPDVGVSLVDGGATVRAVSRGATRLQFVAARTADGKDPLRQSIRPDVAGVAWFRPIADHPYVDVVGWQGPTRGMALRARRGSLLATTPPGRGQTTIIGVNNASGWGHRQARRIRAAQISWARAETGHERVATLRSERFRVLQIVGNIDDRRPLRRVDSASYGTKVVRQVRRDPGADLLEAGNEMYLKGGRCDPRRYARLYMGAEAALRKAGIDTPYLFDLAGSVPGCTQDSETEWLSAALRAQPGLAGKLRANGVALHPYGAARENRGDNWGTRAVNAQANILRTRLGTVPPIYVTEFGFNTCGDGRHSYDRANAAAVTRALKSSYAQFLADPYVKGVFYFHSHDYRKGDCWGLMSANGTPRPQFRALSAIAAGEGQR